GKQLVILRDSEGIVREGLAVSRDVAFMVSLMDGTNTLRDIQAEFMRASGEMVYLERIENLVKILDDNLFLASDRYNEHMRQLYDEYNNSPIRKAYLAGGGYSANRMDLLQFLDEFFEDTEITAGSKDIVGILAPHIDYRRGIKVYRDVYPYLRGSAKPLIVIFGTCHHPTQGLWSISLKDFETPLDIIPCSDSMRELIRDNKFLSRYIEEWPHRIEHSIELQLPLLQFMMQDDFEILPILTGSMHECIEGTRSLSDDEITGLVENFKDVLAAYGKPYCIIAGADLAHIGAQFGDSYPLHPTVLERSQKKDQEILGHIRNCDAGSFFAAIKDEGDGRRICGLTPIFFQLKLLENCASEIVGYDQWTDGKSSVSFAGGIFYR
ncbi:MAG: AmmeMemoRadiSam system protein B, partial [Syntrophorhabdus sp.]